MKTDIYKADSRVVTYMLMPVPVDVMAQFASRYNTSIVCLTEIDWDNDLTPWAAPGVFRHDAPFKGLARAFLETIETRIIPEAEKRLDLTAKPTRNLCGISLSGLFATWAWMQDDTFANIAGISSSFWYDGFTDWLAAYPIPRKTGKAYFSLGDKEGGRHDNLRFQTVRTDTQRVVEILRRAGIAVDYEDTEGNHYANPVPRLEKALSAII